VAAIVDGVSIDTSMGLTPTGGLVMGTRSGDLDPGVLLYLLRECSMTPDGIARLVNHESGLLGLSGQTSDMEELLARAPSDPRATEAIEVFCYHIKKTIGAYAVACGGLDTLVFTGGIGEHAPAIRARICDGLQCLGTPTVHVIPTDEELMIARHVDDVIR
jgi:acetate kinase